MAKLTLTKVPASTTQAHPTAPARVSRSMRSTLAVCGALVLAGLVGGGYGVLTTPAPATAGQSLPSIPRCVNDDWNDGTQDRCWTETTDTHHVLVIDRHDRVISDTH